MNKILLVDDDRELTSLLKELLEMEGFNVIVAHDGEQALDLLDDSIDLLLLDVMMPKKNGIDTLKALRQTHQTPVIMLTAHAGDDPDGGAAAPARQLSEEQVEHVFAVPVVCQDRPGFARGRQPR